MDFTAIVSILSSIIGFALIQDKKDVGKTNAGGSTSTSSSASDNGYSDNSSTSESTNSGQQTIQNEDKRRNSMYLGKDFDGGFYDSFYDYSSSNGGEKLYFRQSYIDNITTNSERVRACRARILAPFVTSELLGEDESFIGSKAKDLNGYCNGLMYYPNSIETITTKNNYTAEVVNLAKGNVRNVCVWLQIFNPSNVDVTIEEISVSNIFIGDVQCQPMHLHREDFPEKKPTNMNDNARWDRGYCYVGGYEGDTESDIIWKGRSRREMIGNKFYFSARELRTEKIDELVSCNAKWLEMAYPIDMVSNIPANNGITNLQNSKLISSGSQKYGLCNEIYDFYSNKPKFLTVPAKGYQIVKVMLPLADLKETAVRFVKSSDVFDLNDKRPKGNYWEVFPYEQCATEDYFEAYAKAYPKLTKKEIEKDIITRFFYIQNNFGVGGYCIFDFKPAPALSNKNLSMTIEMFGDKSESFPLNDPVLRSWGDKASAGNRIDLKIIAQPTSETDNDWRNSYYGTGPDETKSAQTQIGLLRSKTNSNLGDYFDPSINN